LASGRLSIVNCWPLAVTAPSAAPESSVPVTAAAHRRLTIAQTR
jgi:hypothetical protein